MWTVTVITETVLTQVVVTEIVLLLGSLATATVVIKAGPTVTALKIAIVAIFNVEIVSLQDLQIAETAKYVVQ
jgi:hypothetical protein